MRKLLVTAFVSLDGVMQAPGGREEDPAGGFAHGGWTYAYWDDVSFGEMNEFTGRPYDLLLGRKTYDIFASYWPHHPEESVAGSLNAAKKHVASTTLKNPSWGPVEVISENLPERVAQLKNEDGPELQVHGSANMLQTLIPTGLIDQYHLLIFPVVLGKGKRLFGDGAIPAGLKLVSSKTTPSGVIIAVYEPAGAIQLGTIGE